jgi:ribosomal protein S18 acetylase RimI-like enzyme
MAAQPHPGPHTEVLDLRHFSAAEVAPLLREEAARWQARHHWDYTRSVDLLLEYIEGRVLPGFVALGPNKRVLAYTFCVYEGEKAVVGDVYAFGEAEGHASPVSETLLAHLLEMLQATPGVTRIESQLLMFPAGTLTPTYRRFGFHSFPRLFMLADLRDRRLMQPQPATLTSQSPLRLEPWRAEHYNEAAALIHRCYQGHDDALINDQYRTVAGAQRFLHNIIRFPGCGTFDPESSLLLVDPETQKLQAMLLCSRVREDVAHITQLCVNPSLRRLGLGRLLLLRAADDLRRRGFSQVSLTVTENNALARRLYEGLGFAALHRFEATTWDKPSRR